MKASRVLIINKGKIVALPQSPLVRVEYQKQGATYGFNTANPGTVDKLRVVLLAKGVGFSQVLKVCEHKPTCPREVSPNSPGYENQVEAYLARVSSRENAVN